ncbi:hypothetical protein PHYSODRAFT_306710 [Phytophthora sojae]|uniref:Uncharacterized protein n=1 Tax=Phytophthora sojae (strain P6497) TaxID=1094619 RepID=G5AAH3_PHYSP|nr:hypothetical protein PHYSODRAFT_306710 [Phytophthora sojae]EGZ07602.1 hypothetical protein PHYSODRAFT_306710 [Phytophthora sojae]|eukprot:XP_009537168.1 hypothetical protein PHYSODRAFT_306710 [Phytophthora sojae]
MPCGTATMLSLLGTSRPACHCALDLSRHHHEYWDMRAHAAFWAFVSAEGATTVLSCLMSDVGWRLTGDSRSTVVGAIREAALEIEATLPRAKKKNVSLISLYRGTATQLKRNCFQISAGSTQPQVAKKENRNATELVVALVASAT